jgi:hypothetical protein
VPLVLANQTLHNQAKSVRGVAAQICEIAQIKNEFLRASRGTFPEYATVHWCTIKLQFYRFALLTGVIRAYWASRRFLARREIHAR